MHLPFKNFKELKKYSKKDFSNFPVKKVAVLGDSSTQFFVQALKGYGYIAEINFDIFEADYDQIEHEIIDTSSKLYLSKPEYVIIFQSTQKLLNKYFKLNLEQKKTFAEDILSNNRYLTDLINDRLNCKIILFNFGEIDDSVFGNFSNKLDFSFSYQIRKINIGLMDMSRDIKNLFINDICLLQSQYGYYFTFDPQNYIIADLTYSLDFLPVVAKNTVDIIQSLSGKSKKCLILDLDNTLWGGIIAEDGIENIQIGDLGIGKAFTEFQLWIKQLKERGIILAVSSKNDFELAKKTFDNHPDMVLSYEDFAVFNANWDNKAENIRQIQQVLNIGFDSMVFLDDNSFERNLVRNFLPEITIPELPEDPAEYLQCLRPLNLFETSSYSKEDSGRTELYRQEFERDKIKQTFINEEEYLESLVMVSECKPFDSFTIPRVSQLTQRSNQFNLRTIRYTEDDIQKISCSKEYFTLSFTLEDKFGHYGLISLVILKIQNDSLFIDTWIMSCRVLKRTMENFVMNNIAETAITNGFKKLIGEYIPTAKNRMVKDHFKDLGFKKENSLWILELSEFEQRNTSIKVKKET